MFRRITCAAIRHRGARPTFPYYGTFRLYNARKPVLPLPMLYGGPGATTKASPYLAQVEVLTGRLSRRQGHPSRRRRWHDPACSSRHTSDPGQQVGAMIGEGAESDDTGTRSQSDYSRRMPAAGRRTMPPRRRARCSAVHDRLKENTPCLAGAGPPASHASRGAVSGASSSYISAWDVAACGTVAA